jgi:hypothetical protein
VKGSDKPSNCSMSFYRKESLVSTLTMQ